MMSVEKRQIERERQTDRQTDKQTKKERNTKQKGSQKIEEEFDFFASNRSTTTQRPSPSAASLEPLKNMKKIRGH
jgi:hypothetical protein